MKISQITPTPVESDDSSADPNEVDAIVAFDDEELSAQPQRMKDKSTNMRFLKNHDPSLYRKIKSLS